MNQLPSPELQQITVEIKFLKQQTAQNIVEIGNRLTKAKGSLPHGEWGKWLETEAEFTERTAQRFMRASKEFSKTTSMSDLAPTKIIALFDLPEELREEFVTKTHALPSGETKTIDQMSVREVEKAVKAQKEAEEARQKAETQSIYWQKQVAQFKNQPTRTIEVVKEVIPDIIKRQLEEDKFKIDNLRRGYQEQKEKADALERITGSDDPKALESKRKRLQTESEINVLQLKVYINEFLSKASSLSFMEYALSSSSIAHKKTIKESIKSLDEFLSKIKQSVNSELIFTDAQYKEV